MLKRHLAYCAALFACSACLLAGPASACTFEAGPVSTLEIAHPGSLSVAVAIAKAKDQGALPSQDLMRAPFGFHLAVGRIKNFAASLNEVQTGARTDGGFSLLLVGPRLWSGIEPGDAGYFARPHISGPQSYRPVVLTGYLVLAELEQGRLSMRQALDRGLIRVFNDTDDRQIETLLRRQYSL